MDPSTAAAATATATATGIINRNSRATILLEPLNGTFSTKVLELTAEEPIRIGRRVNPMVPAESSNGIFDAKVLSRQHAELILDASKVFIKDLGSSNGTFVNGYRLSEQGVQSAPYELRNNDRLDFGGDILDADGITLVFRKVASKVLIQYDADTLRRTSTVSAGSAATQQSSELIQAVSDSRNSKVTELYSILDDDLRASMEAASVLRQVQKSFDAIEAQMAAAPTSKAAAAVVAAVSTTGASVAGTWNGAASKPNSLTSSAPPFAPAAVPTSNSKLRVATAQIPPTDDALSASLGNLKTPVQPFGDTTLPTVHAYEPGKEFLELSLEQKSTAEKLLEIDGQVNKHAAALADLERSIVELLDKIAVTAKTSESTAVAVAALSKGDSQTAATASNKVSVELDTLREQIASTSTQIHTLESSLSTSLKEVTDAKQRLTGEIRDLSAAHTKRLDLVDRQLATLREHTQLQQSENERLNKQLTILRSDMHNMSIEHTKRGDQLEEARDLIASIKGTMHEFKTELESLRQLATIGSQYTSPSSAALMTPSSATASNTTENTSMTIDSVSVASAAKTTATAYRRKNKKSHADIKETAASQPTANDTSKIVNGEKSIKKQATQQQPVEGVPHKTVALVAIACVVLSVAMFSVALHIFS